MIDPLFSQITIVGPGLLGGSLALACRAQRLAGTVVGAARRPETLEQGLSMGAFDRAFTDLAEAVEGADLVVLGAPVRASMDLLERLAPSLPPGCLLTDIGSTKAEIMAAAKDVLGPGRFVGGHPMAGSHLSGIAFARPDLFQGCLYLLAQDGQTSADGLLRLETLVTRIGGRALWLDAADHDHLAARISHLPHLAAAALVECAAGYSRTGLEATALAATGFRDTTRVAAGHPSMWTDICLTNRSAIVESLDVLIGSLHRLRTLLVEDREPEISQWLEEMARVRESL